MVEYSKVNVKLTDTQLKKLKTAAKNETGTTLRMSLKMFNGSDLPHKLLLSTDIKLSKAQISKIIQSGGFLGSLLNKLAGPFLKVAVPLSKNILTPLGITAAASAIDAGIQKKIYDSGTLPLIILSEEMNEIMKIVQALEDSNILLKGVTETIKHEGKEQKGGFLSTLLVTLGASLLGNLLSGGETARADSGNKKRKMELLELVMEKNAIFNAASSFNKF